MSKRNMRGVILLASALSLGVLGTVVSCNQPATGDKDDDNANDPWKDFVADETIAKLEITNLEALEAEWWVGEDDRQMELDLGATYNTASLIYENKLMAVSSNPDVATVNGLRIQAVAPGTATIEVRAGTHKATVTVTVKQDALEIGGEYTLEEIVSIPNTQKKWFKSSAVITGWTKGSDGQVYGNFNIAKDWSKGATSYIVYGATGKTATEGGSYVNSSGETVTVDSVLGEKDGVFSFNNPRDWLENDNTKDLKVGDKISFDCIRCDYNGTIELSLWNVRFIEHQEFEPSPEPDAVAFTSLATVLEAEAGVKATTKYTGNVKISSIDGTTYGNLHVTDLDGSNETIVYGSTATASALAWDGVNEIFTFANPKDYATNELTKDLVVGQEINVTFIRADYKTTKEVTGIINSAVHIDPTAIAISGDVAEVEEGKTISLTATTTPAFTTRKLTWTSSDPETATVNENGKVTGVKAGTVKITASYGTVVSNEFTVTVKAATTVSTVVAAYNFADFGGTSAVTLPFSISEKLTEGSDIATVSAVTKCYTGQSSYTGLGLKFGTKTEAGMISFDLSVTTATKMTIVGIGWTTSDTISVGETSYTSAHAYTEGETETYEFDITGASQVVVNLTKRYYIQSVTFSK